MKDEPRDAGRCHTIKHLCILFCRTHCCDTNVHWLSIEECSKNCRGILPEIIDAKTLMRLYYDLLHICEMFYY